MGLGWAGRGDDSMAPLLAAGRWLRLSAGAWLMLDAGCKLSREAAGGGWNDADDSFTDICIHGRLRRFVCGPTRSTPGGVCGYRWFWNLHEDAVKR